jgi:hypothetical protein
VRLVRHEDDHLVLQQAADAVGKDVATNTLVKGAQLIVQDDWGRNRG